MNSLFRIARLGIVLALAGCAAVRVRVTDPARAFVRDLEEAIVSAAPETAAGRRERHDLALRAARAHWQGALAGDARALVLYNAAVGSLIADREGLSGTRRAQIADSLALDLESGLDPRQAELVLPAAAIKIGRPSPRVVQSGLGVPCVMVYPPDAPWLRGQPGVPKAGLCLPSTAVVSFPRNRPTLTFVPTWERTEFAAGKTRARLACDFSAPLALLAARGPNRSLDLGTMFLTAKRMDRARLGQLAPLDQKKIPVVLIHGLMSRPETWLRLVNSAQADPRLREKYQFWPFVYPTGLPVWASAAILRDELDRFEAAGRALGFRSPFPGKVLIGHSMGGLVASLLIRDGWENLWGRISDVPFGEALRGRGVGARLARYADFTARRDVARVVFAAVPHRGAPMAHRPIASLGAALIRLPDTLDRVTRQELLGLLRGNARRALAAPANSIRFLRSNSPLVLSILELPRDESVPVHSIIGNRGRGGPLEESSDGVVPYWSSHLDFAVSERVVPSGHGAHVHPEGVGEILRVLRLHAGLRGGK